MASTPMSALRPRVDVEQASHYLRLLYGGAAGFGSLILLGNGRRERHCFFDVAELRDDSTSLASSLEALQSVVDENWNVYASMATFERVPDRGRGTRADVLSVPGVWADIDIKPDVEGYCASSGDVATLLSHLPRPSVEVASGSGGRHLYWLTHDRLTADEGRQLLLEWLDFLRAQSDGRIIENVHDTTRILRVPGTVRWPKIADQVQPMPRRVEIVREGPRYPADELREFAVHAHGVAEKVRRAARQERARERELQQWNLVKRGLQLQTFERVVMAFNAQQDWEPLLTAAGWTLFSDERGGAASCRYWTRPGKSVADGKSASTDFVGDGVASHLMSVYTKDEALLPLWENADSHDGIGLCSKWKFVTACLGATDTELYHLVHKTGVLP